MGKGLPSLDKEGMPGSDSGPRQGWLESARDCPSAAFLDHPVLDFVSATPPHPREGSSNPPAPKVLSSYKSILNGEVSFETGKANGKARHRNGI
jgi:hypothetical protein